MRLFEPLEWLYSWFRSPVLALRVRPRVRDSTGTELEAHLEFAVDNCGFSIAKPVKIRYMLVDWDFEQVPSSWLVDTSDAPGYDVDRYELSKDGRDTVLLTLDAIPKRNLYVVDTAEIHLEDGEYEIEYEMEYGSYRTSEGSVFLIVEDSDIEIDHRDPRKVRGLKKIRRLQGQIRRLRG